MWTPLILRDVFFGLRRFDQICADLGIASNVLTARLETLVDKGILERVRYQERPPRYEYRPTRKGKDLFSILLAMMHWGDTWFPERGGPPVCVRHKACGQSTMAQVVCSACRKPLSLDNVSVHAGPSAVAAPGTALLATELPRENIPARPPRKRLRERFDPVLVVTLEAIQSAGARYRRVLLAARKVRAQEHNDGFRLACEGPTADESAQPP